MSKTATGHEASQLERWLAVVNDSGEGAEEDWIHAVGATPPGVAEAMRALLDAHRHVEALQAAVNLGAYWHARAQVQNRGPADQGLARPSRRRPEIASPSTGISRRSPIPLRRNGNLQGRRRAVPGSSAALLATLS